MFRRMKGERGASLVEFALVLPVLLLLVFGIIDFGFAFNDYQSLRQGVRDGARQGVVTAFGSSMSCGLNGSAASATDNTKKLICTTKNRTGLGNGTRVALVVLHPTDDTAPATFAKGNRLLVCAQRPATSVSGFFSVILNGSGSTGKQFRSKVLMRIEKNTPTVTATTESGDFSWCTA